MAETLRAALNELATVAPAWLHGIAPLAWYERYAKRIENSRLPKEPSKQDAYAQTVSEDGFQLLDALESPEAPATLRTLPCVATLRQLWQDHYERQTDTGRPEGAPTGPVRFKEPRELPRAATHIESPYDVDARYRPKGSTQWTVSIVHMSESCEDTTPHLLTHYQRTSSAIHQAMCTDAIHPALTEQYLAPQERLVDAAYVDAALLVQSRQGMASTCLVPPVTMRVGRLKWTVPMTSTNSRLTGTTSRSGVRRENGRRRGVNDTTRAVSPSSCSFVRGIVRPVRRGRSVPEPSRRALAVPSPRAA